MSSGPRKVDGFDGATQDHVVKIIMHCSSTTGIAVGDVVMVNTADTTYGLGNTVIEATQALGALAVGVCDKRPQKEDGTVLASGDMIVQVAGIRTDVNCHADTVAGDRLAQSATAGRLSPIEDICATGSVSQAEGILLARAGNGVAISLTDDGTVTNVCTARLLDPLQLAH
jgi:hypothetical protein